MMSPEDRGHRNEIRVPHETLTLIEEYGGLPQKATHPLPVVGGRPKPATEMQALMEAEPFVEPEESVEEHEAKVEPLRALLDSGLLDERELWIVQAHYYRRLSFDEIGRELQLSKSYVHRICKAAEEKLGAALTAAADTREVE